ncbi:hypothetical protein [Bradyrhizobium diazoefficiens]
MQVRICGIAANLAILGHEVPQLAAQLRHISSVVIAAEGNAVARPPHETAVLPVLIGIDCRSAERLAEQARCHGVTGRADRRIRRARRQSSCSHHSCRNSCGQLIASDELAAFHRLSIGL